MEIKSESDQRQLVTKIVKSNSRKPKFQPYYCITSSHQGNRRWNRQRTRSENNGSEEPMNQDLINNAEQVGGGSSLLEYGHKMDCEMNIIHEKNFQMEFDSQHNSGQSIAKELAVVGAKIKRSKSLDNMLLKTAQETNRNSSTLEFPSMLSRFRDLQFNE